MAPAAYLSLALMITLAPSQALTLKTGKVLGSDGNIYESALPAEKAALIVAAERTGNSAGVVGSNIYVVIAENVTFVPIRKIQGKQTENIKQIVGDLVIQDVAGIEGLQMSALETARKLADEQGISLVDAFITQILTETNELEVNKFLTPLFADQQAGILEQLQNSETFDPAAREQLANIAEDIDREAFWDMEKLAEEIERVESVVAEVVAAQEAVSVPGGLLDRLDSGEIIQEQLTEQSASMPGFEGHCDTNCWLEKCKIWPLTLAKAGGRTVATFDEDQTRRKSPDDKGQWNET